MVQQAMWDNRTSGTAVQHMGSVSCDQIHAAFIYQQSQAARGAQATSAGNKVAQARVSPTTGHWQPAHQTGVVPIIQGSDRGTPHRSFSFSRCCSCSCCCHSRRCSARRSRRRRSKSSSSARASRDRSSKNFLQTKVEALCSRLLYAAVCCAHAAMGGSASHSALLAAWQPRSSGAPARAQQ